MLFDEIDAFLLDRDSELYRRQDTLFQFLTPGMLTKINDLRAQARCIFIIATNYANRIDPAIKRSGRIDRKYLLSLPDRVQRVHIVSDRLDRPVKAVKEVAAASLFLGYSDIVGAVDDAGGPSATDGQVIAELAKREPSTSLVSYARRFGEENYPYDELRQLTAMARDVGRNDAIDTAVREVPLMQRSSFKRKLK
jgi:SpoVK/Ycf46/Vps4 family AAA+-type ATPase